MTNKKEGTFKTSIGGQALIEGILMRGPKVQSIVVRSPEGLVTKVEELKLIRDKHPILGLPIIRGAVTFVDSMIKGVQALMYSADFFPDEEVGQPSKLDEWLEKHVSEKSFKTVVTAVSVVLSIVLSLLLFLLIPTFLAGFVDAYIDSPIVHNIIEGVIKIIIFLGYLILCSKQKDVARVFRYHGAEHKTIFCYEAGLDLTVENVRAQPKHHPRCGTSFLFVVIVVSILVSSIVFSLIDGWKNIGIRILVKLIFLIPVVGITYEFNRWVGRHDNKLTRFLSAPGMWMQNFTTNEPDDSMIEVAIEALKLVLPDEKGSDKW